MKTPTTKEQWLVVIQELLDSQIIESDDLVGIVLDRYVWPSEKKATITSAQYHAEEARVELL